MSERTERTKNSYDRTASIDPYAHHGITALDLLGFLPKNRE